MKHTLAVNGMELLNMRVPLRVISKKNSKARNRFTGAPFLGREARALQSALQTSAMKYRVEAVPYGGTVAVEIIAHFKNGTHCDTGNVSEVVLDSLQGAVIRNDKQVGPLLVVPCECGEDAVTVRVRTTEPQRGPCVAA